LLAEKYGWTIEYIMKLTRRQVRVLLEGQTEIVELQDKAQKDYDRNKGNNNTNVNISNDGNKDGKSTGSGLYELMSLPGMKMSEKARNKIKRVMESKIKKKEATNA